MAPHKALVALGLALTLWVFAFAPRGLFSGDSGVKVAQSYALWTSGFSSRALPAQPDLDPAGEYTGYGEFKRRVNGEWQGIYSLTFTALAAPLIGVFGLTGLAILPLLGTLLLVAGTYALARRIGCDRWWAVAVCAVTAFATPVLFYSSQLTEHPLATGLVTWALVLVIPEPTSASRRELLAGALVGFAATIRPECYLAIAAVGIALVVPPWTSATSATSATAWPMMLRRGARFAAGALAIVIPYWLANERLSDTWDPLVTFQQRAAAGWNNVGLLLVGATRAPVSGIYIAYALCLVSGALPAPLARRSRIQAARVVLLAAVVGLTVMVSYQRWHGTTGLFTVTPLAIVGVWASASTPVARRAWIGSAVFLLGVLALTRSGDGGGLQLGARLLLPVLPALLCLGCAHLQAFLRGHQHRAVRALFLVALTGLLALTAIAIVPGTIDASSIARDGERAARLASSSRAKVVVTTVWWQSQILAPALLDGKVLLLAADPAQLPPLLAQLRAHGVSEIIVVHLPHAPGPPGPGEIAIPWGPHAQMSFEDVHLGPAPGG